MSVIGTKEKPLRVAIAGSGPSGFYAAEQLFKQKELTIEADLFDKLPTPFGLVRYGVAPDHQKIKTVARQYDRIATHPRFRFFGNIEIGKDVNLDDLQRHYHMILFATGAQSDRRLGIFGEHLKRSHAATEFVAWYNGHPEYRDLQFDLSVDAAVVVGVGNVAMDLARILCRTQDELKQTDIADYALEQLAESKIKTVYILGRRGPMQSAFTLPELKELGKLEDADVEIAEHYVDHCQACDHLSDHGTDRQTQHKLDVMREYARREPAGKSKKIVFKFLTSPVKIHGDEAGNVVQMQIVRNELCPDENNTCYARPTNDFDELDVGIVFRSVGYRGVPVPDVPFHEKWGVIPNENGRVVEENSNKPIPGLYAAGWIKRGPSGVIGTNKTCAAETVQCMLEDLETGSIPTPEAATAEAALKMIREHQPALFTYEDWRKLNEIEIQRGETAGRPRVKFTCVEEMLQALGRPTKAMDAISSKIANPSKA